MKAYQINWQLFCYNFLSFFSFNVYFCSVLISENCSECLGFSVHLKKKKIKCNKHGWEWNGWKILIGMNTYIVVYSSNSLCVCVCTYTLNARAECLHVMFAFASSLYSISVTVGCSNSTSTSTSLLFKWFFFLLFDAANIAFYVWEK